VFLKGVEIGYYSIILIVLIKSGSVYFTSDIYSGGNRSAGAIVPAVKHSVLLHDDAIPRKRSLCQENVLVV